MGKKQQKSGSGDLDSPFFYFEQYILPDNCCRVPSKTANAFLKNI